MKVYKNAFDHIASIENLFAAWNAFKGNKRNKDDVQRFERHLEQNIFQLHRDLTSGSYRHGPYYGFYIHDPKQRHIHKASVRDRVLHHAIVSVINPMFEETFNLTSQLFANAYMNEFDQFVKHNLKVKQYARYTDDFVIIASNREYLENLIEPISRFLNDRLALALHPKKVSIGKLHNGVDFLGYVVFPKHRLIRAKTRRRMFTKFAAKIAGYRAGSVSEGSLIASLQSYLGVLSHADALQMADKIKNLVWFLS